MLKLAGAKEAPNVMMGAFTAKGPKPIDSASLTEPGTGASTQLRNKPRRHRTRISGVM